MKLGSKMLNELAFYEIDLAELGSVSEDYEEDDENEQDKLAALIKA